MADELFTIAQAAQYLKVCDKTVRRLIKTNQRLEIVLGELERPISTIISTITLMVTKGAFINE